MVEKFNTAQKGRISVQKSGEIFNSVSENNEKYTPIFEEKGLENAVFHVIAAEDIITADGAVRANAGDVVAELVTDENGYAESDLLYLGKYEVKEITAPYGYVKNPEIQAVELVYAGQEIAVRDTVNSSFYDDYQGVEISLEKFMEHDELFGIGDNDEYKAVRFGLFASEEIVAADGTAIPENGLIAEVTLDENMKSVIAEKLPFGRYYVQEIATDEHYILNGEKYLVNFEYMGQEMTTVYVDCGQFVNELKRGTVKGIKVNESDEPLENALFGLFDADCTEFTADNAIMTEKSDEQGKFEFVEIPYGEYIVKEIAAPTGYILSDESYHVTISEDEEVIEITAKNQPITVEMTFRNQNDAITGNYHGGDILPKLIVTSRYLKSGSGKNLSNYVKYIATREDSVTVKENNGTAPATQKQQELILFLLKEFPESTETFEYDDYKNNSTQKNASRFISEMLERNADRIANRENYVGYLANRPGAVKFGSHGLFSQEDTSIDLEKTAKEIANHKGNVWTHVISLRRDDAQKMGYDNLNAWRELVKRQIPNIAQAQKIDMKNLKWYAAFHDKKNNPHVHIIVYSTNEREGFLTNHGIEKIRSGFANDIYAGELHHLYEQQTDLRNLLKKEYEQLMKSLAESISQNNNFDAELINLVSKLHGQLAESKGKKVYGYLKPDVKKTVDAIFARLADNESIKKMYDLWCEMEQQKHDVYSSAKVQFPNLVDNKEFKSVKNMIVQTVLQMDFPVHEIEVEMPEPDLDIPLQIDEEVINETVDNSVEISPQSKLYIKWSDSYKESHKLICNKESTLEDYKKAEKLLLSESNNVLTFYDLGRLYSADKSGIKDDEKSFEFYEKALQGFLQIEPTAKKVKSYLQYQIGMMYFKGLGTSIDNQKAAKYFEKSAELGNQYAKRLLAFEYISGKNFEKDIEKGISLLTECADSGDAFFCYKLGNLYLKGEIINQDLDKAEKYLLTAEDNEFTQYALGKLYLQKEKYDIKKAISYFEKSADKNMWASYQLGRLYLFGTDGLKKEKEKAMQFFNLSAEQGNEYAQNVLDNQEKFENEMLASTIFSLFINLSRCIEDDYHNKFQSGRKMIDNKLRRVIQEKNRALGIKHEHGHTQEY